jgi:hypothetical protein
MRLPVAHLVIALALAATAGLAEAETLILTNADLTVETFPPAAESIRSHMLEGGAHAGLSTAQKDRIDHFLARIEGYLASGQPRDRPKIGQLQLRINAMLTPEVAGTHNTSEMLCRREKPIGSRIVQTVCYDRQALEDNARQLQTELINMEEPGGTYD